MNEDWVVSVRRGVEGKGGEVTETDTTKNALELDARSHEPHKKPPGRWIPKTHFWIPGACIRVVRLHGSPNS